MAHLSVTQTSGFKYTLPDLHVDDVLDVLVTIRLPLVEPVHLVERDDEWRLLVLEQVD